MTTTSPYSRQKVALVVCPLGSRWNVPMALPSLAAFVEMYDYEVKCWDLNLGLQDSLQARGLSRSLLDMKKWRRLEIDDPQIESILAEMVVYWAEMILRDGPTVVGLSLTLVNVRASLMLAKAIKKLTPNVLVVVGGPECMLSWPELILQDVVDFVVLGEGERPLVDLLQTLDRGLKHVDIPAVVTKEAKRQLRTAAVNADLDRLPYPDFSKMELARYADRGVVDLPIFGSVGCIRNCTFCSSRFFWSTYRYKSPERIVGELQHAIETYGTTSFLFVDLLINGRIDQLFAWTSAVVDRRMEIRWHANAILTPGTTRQLLYTMRQSGCTRLWYGLESGSSDVLKDMRKYANIQDIERIIRDTHEVGIFVDCFLIVGYPTETETDFQATLHFLERNKSYIDEVYPFLYYMEDENTLGQEREKYRIVGNGDDWHSSTSTLDLRKERLDHLLSVLDDLGIHTHQETGRDFDDIEADYSKLK